MFDLDLPSAITSHFEPRVQQGLIYRNLQSTQDILAYLAKLQGWGIRVTMPRVQSSRYKPKTSARAEKR